MICLDHCLTGNDKWHNTEETGHMDPMNFPLQAYLGNPPPLPHNLANTQPFNTSQWIAWKQFQ
jgi:hypothetical protein